MYSYNNLPKDLLPARTLPRPDELLSSWIVRLAMAHGLKLHTFCTLLWGKQAIWNRDIDKCADDRILTLLERRTGTVAERVRETTLSSYEGKLYEHHNALGNTFWIMPLGIYHRVRRMHGTQFCASCLAEDKVPYFRRIWRLAFATVCTKHRCALIDGCPRCDSPVNFHRDELGERSKQVATSMVRCFVCRVDLRTVRSPAMRDDIVDSNEYQSALIRAIEDGWMNIGAQPIFSLLYFPVLRQLMKVLATHRGSLLLASICRETKTAPFAPLFPAGRTDIESLRVEDRHKLKEFAAYILEDWPGRFIRICEAGRVWSSTLLRDFKDAPFWYRSVINDQLYRKSYRATDEEIWSTIAHINCSGGVANQKAISDLLGVQNVFRKRKNFTDFYLGKFGRVTLKIARLR